MTKDNSTHSDKKNLQKELIFQLDNSLGKLKDFLGEKKFNSRIKKAVKLLTEGIDTKKMKKDEPKAAAAPKKVQKKAITPKVAVAAHAKAAPVKTKVAVKKPVAVKTQTKTGKES